MELGLVVEDDGSAIPASTMSDRDTITTPTSTLMRWTVPMISLYSQPVFVPRVVARRDLKQERPGLQGLETNITARNLHSSPGYNLIYYYSTPPLSKLNRKAKQVFDWGAKNFI